MHLIFRFTWSNFQFHIWIHEVYLLMGFGRQTSKHLDSLDFLQESDFSDNLHTTLYHSILSGRSNAMSLPNESEITTALINELNNNLRFSPLIVFIIIMGLSLLMFGTVCGNLLVISAILTDKHLRVCNKAFLTNLIS